MTPGLYRHAKGGLYRLIGQGTHSETHEAMCIYQEVNTEAIWVRPTRMWSEEVTWPDGKKRPRFIPAGKMFGERAEPDKESLDGRPREANGS